MGIRLFAMDTVSYLAKAHFYKYSPPALKHRAIDVVEGQLPRGFSPGYGVLKGKSGFSRNAANKRIPIFYKMAIRLSEMVSISDLAKAHGGRKPLCRSHLASDYYF